MNSIFRGRRLSRLAMLAVVAAAAICVPAGHGDAQQSSPQASERAIKAAFLYKFAEYVDWPSISTRPRDTPFTIGVLGSGPLADDLLRMTADRTVDDRPIRVRRLAPNDSVDDLQVLFIAGERQDALGELLTPVKGQPILTVTESEGALAEGSIINFTVMGERVRFEVSLGAAQDSRLRLSSRLLAVAENVYQSP